MKSLRLKLAAALLLALSVTALAWAADLTITAASTKPSTGAQLDASHYAGEAITAGQPLYVKAADGLCYLADANASSATATVVGIAANGAAIGQPVTYQKAGSMTIGATLTKGEKYCVSATAGKICPFADLTTGDYISELGTASSASVLSVKINVTGIQK